MASRTGAATVCGRRLGTLVSESLSVVGWRVRAEGEEFAPGLMVDGGFVARPLARRYSRACPRPANAAGPVVAGLSGLCPGKPGSAFARGLGR